jgi:hypothetical protein
MLLSRREVAQRLRVTAQALSKWNKQGGGPPCFKIGSNYKYDSDQFEAWLAAQQQSPNGVVRPTQREGR